MGHVDPVSTAVYLTITPALLEEASRRFEALRRASLDGGGAMKAQPLGPVLHSYFLDHLITVKGLRPASVRSYRDTIRLLLLFIAADKRCKITRLTLDDLTFERVSRSCATWRRTAATTSAPATSGSPRCTACSSTSPARAPEMLAVCQQVAAIPTKRVPLRRPASSNATKSRHCCPACPATDGWRCATARSCCSSTTPGHASKKPPTYAPSTSTSASTRSCASTARAANGGPARSGSRQRARSPTCSPHMTRRPARSQRYSPRTGSRSPAPASTRSCAGTPASFDDPRTGRKISPHTFRHTAAVHLLEAGVEVNVIRGWLGHVDLSTTNRYAEINTKAKLAAAAGLRTAGCIRRDPAPTPIWRSDETLLNWLTSL